MRTWLLAMLAPLAVQAAPVLTSPDGALSVSMALDETTALRYTVSRAGGDVLLPSRLGLRLDGLEWVDGLALKGCGPVTSGRERYALTGKKRRVDQPYRAVACRIVNSRGQVLRVEWRAFNDGVAFRYVVAEAVPLRKRFVEELTSFRFPAAARAWLQPMQVAQTGWKNTNPAYEEHYRRDIPVGEPSPSPAGWVFPALYRVGDATDPSATWVALTEAGMDGSFHASRLQTASEGGEYRLGQPMAAEVVTGGGRLADVAGPMTTPWRVIAAAPLPALMASTLGTDLAAPAVPFAADRIKPGPASWSWALLKDDGTVYDVQKRFIDYAADMRWPYTLIDADWDRKIGWERIQALIAHARSRQVGLWLWYNSSGAWNETEYSPKGALIDPAQRRAEFRKLADAGIKGLKIDFFAGDGQSVIRYYVDLLEDAARAGLLLNFHGATLPRGWNRTYPNLMTAEAVKGFEFATFEQADQDAVPAHLAMLPFARNLFDPMDFTPVVFGDIPKIKRATRNGFELALSVLLLSGVQHYAETPEGMAAVPEYVRAFLRGLPRQWDDVRFLAGEPGKSVALARRAGDRWVVAAINAEAEPRTLSLDLRFLAGRIGTLIGEGDGPRDFRTEALRGGGVQRITLPARGGFVASFEPGHP